jgi:pimeloyl-ACP methyl ester carboxylesterase
MSATRRGLALLALVAASGCALSQVHAQPGGGLLSAGARTMGGRMMWTDEVVFDGWRIQRNPMIGHYRLLDPNDLRMTFGSFDNCLAKFDEIKAQEKLPPMPKDVVIVVHGLGAYRFFMDGICDYLTDNGLHVVNVGYASTMDPIDRVAQSLDSIVRHLDGTQNVSFVAHSMGNIVIRRYLYDLDKLAPEMRPKVTFQRFVMISPPNHGAELADDLANRQIINSAAKMALGEAYDILAPSRGWPELEKKLATPNFQFGIIAGGAGNDSGYLPNVPGDDDGLLSVETMKLAGAADFIQTNGLHQLMPNYKEVRQATLNFLLHGYFVSPEARQPLVAAVAR